MSHKDVGSSPSSPLCRACGSSGFSSGGEEHKLRLCARCRAASYCSVECQRRDWPAHKLVCRSEADASAAGQTPLPAAQAAQLKCVACQTPLSAETRKVVFNNSKGALWLCGPCAESDASFDMGCCVCGAPGDPACTFTQLLAGAKTISHHICCSEVCFGTAKSRWGEARRRKFQGSPPDRR